ncbi:hypothetical protein CO683_13195 [Bradyrhizobium ottawaense]|nr:hypothetical protein [Bradyrhizobium sp. CCBAU 45394]MDA9490965.1 hypothetical protein [Bradyrhizobium sp. CCBAU 11361]MDA9504770.1 hypothetical protein [Bradyrhizobium sp. CCBAU 11386]MDA9537208.1 hypothetical protein [Bradyrhizobium sp. CCBAU 21362]PDT68955.1 hypothetical protein CO683_13195 [Bradyrhizobium ottawaense]
MDIEIVALLSKGFIPRRRSANASDKLPRTTVAFGTNVASELSANADIGSHVMAHNIGVKEPL